MLVSRTNQIGRSDKRVSLEFRGERILKRRKITFAPWRELICERAFAFKEIRVTVAGPWKTTAAISHFSL